MRLLDDYEQSSDILVNIAKNLNKLLLINTEYKKINEKFNESLSLLIDNLNEIRNDISIDEEETATIEEVDIDAYKT